MTRALLQRPLRTLALLAALAAVALVSAVPASAGARQANRPCAEAGAHPSELSQSDERRATLCLINAERRARGREPLRHNPRLALAGARHARDMVEHDYFAHDSRDGRTFVDRIMAAGYVGRRSSSWLLGENLAWGTSGAATPAAIVDAWMDSPGHRANILNRSYREIGIAVVPGTPTADDELGATYATEFGLRR